eukprot:symbB.v1.2.009809.t3/scaffold627.1/size179893/1
MRGIPCWSLRKRWRRQVREAINLNKPLREELATWPPKVEKVKEKWEDARVQIAYWGVKASAREGAAFPLLLTLALEWRPIGERRSVTAWMLGGSWGVKVLVDAGAMCTPARPSCSRHKGGPTTGAEVASQLLSQKRPRPTQAAVQTIEKSERPSGPVPLGDSKIHP